MPCGKLQLSLFQILRGQTLRRFFIQQK
jgi:hypothetical protein